MKQPGKCLKALMRDKCKRKQKGAECLLKPSLVRLYIPRDFSRLSDVWLLCFSCLGIGRLSLTFWADAAVAKLLINLWLIS